MLATDMDVLSDDGAGETPALEAVADRDERLSTAVVEAVSEASGTPPLGLPVLARAVDVRALDEMPVEYQTEWRLEFRYYGHDVVVEGDRSIAVYPSE